MCTKFSKNCDVVIVSDAPPSSSPRVKREHGANAERKDNDERHANVFGIEIPPELEIGASVFFHQRRDEQIELHNTQDRERLRDR